MIIPSIDIQNGRAVQLRGGETFVLDGGDPIDRLAEFSMAGEVAVIDLDAAMGTGSNTDLIREMAQQAPIRVGGGIRDEESAYEWLDAGVEKIIIGTAATPEFCGRFPRERVIAAVDARNGMVVSHGWKTTSSDSVAERLGALAPFVGGFLYTQVENEGRMNGFDKAALTNVMQSLATACGPHRPHPRITYAGGITSTDQILELDRLGIDAQVGMALYSGAVSLGAAISAPLGNPDAAGLWPTIVVDESDRALGLVWSSEESIRLAVKERQGIYWSRSRNEIWRKGETSGNGQELLKIDLDCDRDCLRFTVRQTGVFCHTGTYSCFGPMFGLPELLESATERILGRDATSGTYKAATEPGLLKAKLIEEARELAEACDEGSNVAHEAADVLYFVSVALAKSGISLDEIMRELGRRNKRVRRRPMARKEDQ
jgi:phosphoribosylformimino-5-aminoimidazole carboxamide ribotide isomerase